MARCFQPAIGNTIEERLCPIPSGMGSYRQPKISSASQGGGCKQREKCSRNNSQASFTSVAHVRSGKNNGHENGGGPETNSVSQGVQRVSPKQEFLQKSHYQKHKKPE